MNPSQFDNYGYSFFMKDIMTFFHIALNHQRRNKRDWKKNIYFFRLFWMHCANNHWL